MADDEREGGGGWWPERKPEGKPEAERSGGGAGGGGGTGGGPERGRPRGLASPDAPKRASRYSMFVGLAFFAIVVIAMINLLRNDDNGTLGVNADDAGKPVAEFAVPDARGTLEGDANIFQDDCASAENPCPSEDVRDPACQIDPEGAIRICDLFDKPLAISFWFTRGGDCIAPQDAFDDAAAKYGDDVNFLSLNVRDSRDTVQGIIDERGWKVPVGLDPDGAVSNLFRVGGCPTLLLAYPGGIIYGSPIAYEPDEVDGFIEDLLRASRERAETSR